MQLKEGAVTDIKVDVCADDGKTTKIYIIHVKRLSTKDAILTSLKFDVGAVVPEFSPEVYEYTCNYYYFDIHCRLECRVDCGCIYNCYAILLWRCRFRTWIRY